MTVKRRRYRVRDPRSADSIAALERLHNAGYRLVMLTDNPTTANAIAKEAGIDEVIAGVLPWMAKADAIKRLQSRGRQVCDGRSDGQRCAQLQADVGIAMGGGSDVAIETAAITLMRHSLMRCAGYFRARRCAI